MSAPLLSHCWLELPDGRNHWLSSTCAIGRQPDNDLVLELPTLSRRHALLVPEGGGYTLSDLHSRNGTFVNGAAITRPVRLRHGDEIRVGEAQLRFHSARRLDEHFAGTPDVAVTQRLDQLKERPCWLLLVDVAGSATLNQQIGSEAAHRQIQAWIAGLQPLVERGGGRINGYLGDALFAFWPAEDAARGAIASTLDAIEAWRPASPLAFRVVVHHGRVLFTHSDRGEELTGQDVNFLFRSEKVAKSLGAPVLLSEAAVQAFRPERSPGVVGRSTIEGVTGSFVFYGWS